MCLKHDHHVELSVCPHGAFQLRAGNASLHLTQEQVILLHTELNRCVRSDASPTDAQPSRRLDSMN